MDLEVIREASTVEEAIDAALDELGVQQDVVDYEVLEEPGRRIFGGEKAAKVKVWIREEFAHEFEAARTEAVDRPDVPADAPEESAGETPEGESDAPRGDSERGPLSDEELDQVADAGTEVLESLLGHLDVEGEIEEYEGEDGEIILDIVGPDLGILIGRHGKTLDALQVIVSSMTRTRLGWYHPVVVDVEGYRSRRKSKLEEIARNAADRAARQGRDVRMRPMNSYERKIIHITLRNDKRVETGSEGEEPDRAVVVTPR